MSSDASVSAPKRRKCAEKGHKKARTQKTGAQQSAAAAGELGHIRHRRTQSEAFRKCSREMQRSTRRVRQKNNRSAALTASNR